MDYAQVEAQFKTLKEQFTAGKLDEAAFKSQLQNLMVQDEGGCWWMIGYETGQWYTHDGSAWVRAEPPVRTTLPPPAVKEKVEFSPTLIAAVEKAKQTERVPVAPLPSSGEKKAPAPLSWIQEVKRIGWGFWLGWIGALGAGCVVFLLLVGINPYYDKLVTWCLVAGSVVGVIQWLILRKYLQGSIWWVLINVLFVGIVGGLVADGSYYNYNRQTSDFGVFLAFLYPILNVIVSLILVLRKRRSGASV